MLVKVDGKTYIKYVTIMIIKQTKRLNNQCMTRLRNDDGGGTASQDGNLTHVFFHLKQGE